MNDRIRYLDGLRGILAIIVFLHHYFYTFCPDLIFGGSYENFLHTGPFSAYKLIGLTPLNILFNPGFAIHFFFLLSGYVQTHSYFVQPDISFLQKSLLKRYFRLAIPVLAVVILVYIFHSTYLIRKDLIPLNELNKDWLKGMLPNNLQFLQVLREGLVDCFRGNSRYYQILWTMSTELINSVVVLCLLLIFHNLKHKTAAFSALILVQLVVLQEYYSVAFVAGMLFANLEVHSLRFNQFLARPLVKALFLLLGIYFGSYPFTGYQNAVAHSVYAPISFFEVYPHVISYLIAVCLLFCFLVHSPFTQRLLLKKIFLFFGKISFMFYLIHFLLLLSLTPRIYQSLAAQQSTTTNLVLTGLCSFLIITVAAFLLTKLIDQPVIKACSRFAKKFF